MTSLRITPFDTAVVVVCFLLTLAIGAWMGRRKVRSVETLFLADREATWPLIGASLFAANISSQQFVGQAGLAYAIGLVAGGFQLVGAFCFTLLAVFFVDVYLGLRLRTAPEFFERRYHVGARVCVSAINLIIVLGANVTTALYAGATVLTDLAGWNSPVHFYVAIVVIAAGAGVTTIIGGLRSVLWMDLLLSAVLVAGGAVTFFACLHQAGGWSAVLPMRDDHGVPLWSVIQPWWREFGWLPLATGAVVLGVHGHCTDQDYVQRALSARSLFHSKMGALFAALLKIAALFIIAAPGVLAAKLLPGLPHPDQAYARLVATYVPAGLIGLVFAGLFSAILGSVSAGLAASSSLISYDFIGRLMPAMSEPHRVRLGRIIMAVLLVLCAVFAPGIRQFQGVYVYIVRLGAAFGPAVFVCVVAGIFTRRASGRGATATLIAGTLFGLASYWMQDTPHLAAELPVYLRSSLNTSFVNTLFCTGVMLLWSRRAEGEPRAREIREACRSAPLAPMTVNERRIYFGALGGLAVLWLAVLLAFSPWGLPREKSAATAAAQPAAPARAPSDL